MLLDSEKLIQLYKEIYRKGVRMLQKVLNRYSPQQKLILVIENERRIGGNTIGIRRYAIEHGLLENYVCTIVEIDGGRVYELHIEDETMKGVL